MDFLTTIEYEGALKEALSSHKVVIFRNRCLPSCHESFYRDIASDIGELVPMEECLLTGDKNGEMWTDIRYDCNISNSYRHSNTRQPLHTDGSYEAHAPNISFFYCIRPARLGGATTFLDSTTLFNCLDKELRDRLERFPILFAKGVDSKQVPAIVGEKLTWNYFRAVECEDTELPNDFHRFLEDRVVESGITENVYLSVGDAVFFQDELVLHGRNAFFGDRWLRKGGIKQAV